MALLHGLAGGWDELAIAGVAVGVLWVAVRLAGRKPANDEDQDEDELVAPDGVAAGLDKEQTDPEQRPTTKPR